MENICIMIKRKRMSNARRIIQIYFNNIYPEHIRKNFTTWLKLPKDEEVKDEALQEIWDNLNIESDSTTEESYRKLQSRIFTNTSSEKKSSFFSIRMLYRAAAILLLPLLSVTATYLYMKKDFVATEDIKLVEHMVPNGETHDIILPDLSKVKLNAGSILIFQKHFGKTRTVYLNGEAYFNVSHDKTKPFIVNTTDMEVEVLGTVFNVSSYSGDNHSSTTLESGKVNVRFKNVDYQEVTLVPNEWISYDRSTGLIKKQKVKVENIVAWTKGNVLLQGVTIEEITKIIERRYGINVYLNSQNYRNERITMKLDSTEGIHVFMDILHHLIPGLRYSIENDKVYIY